MIRGGDCAHQKVLSAFLALMLMAFCGVPVLAQSWQAKALDDATYIAANVAYPGLGMGFTCHAETGNRSQITQSIWFESSIAPQGQFVLSFSEDLIPTRPELGLSPPQKNDLIVFAGENGYRLPGVNWNELSGSWETYLSMQDPLFAALAVSGRVVLQVDAAQAWELPVAGLAAALEGARSHCLAPRRVAQAGVALPSAIQTYANQSCGGVARIGPKAVQSGDFDADGTPDFVLDWGDVLCPGETRSGNCGAANCLIDLFLSSRGYALSHSVLAVGVRTVVHRSGRSGLVMGGTARVCGAIDCSVPWLWNGHDLVQVP